MQQTQTTVWWCYLGFSLIGLACTGLLLLWVYEHWRQSKRVETREIVPALPELLEEIEDFLKKGA